MYLTLQKSNKFFTQEQLKRKEETHSPRKTRKHYVNTIQKVENLFITQSWSSSKSPLKEICRFFTALCGIFSHWKLVALIGKRQEASLSLSLGDFSFSDAQHRILETMLIHCIPPKKVKRSAVVIKWPARKVLEEKTLKRSFITSNLTRNEFYRII